MNDNRVTRDWRGENPTGKFPHVFPENFGFLWGAPLTEPCPESHAEAGAWCATCGGSGRVRPGKPKTKTQGP